MVPCPCHHVRMNTRGIRSLMLLILFDEELLMLSVNKERVHFLFRSAIACFVEAFSEILDSYIHQFGTRWACKQLICTHFLVLV